MLAGLVATLVSAPGGADAALAPEHYEQARLTAPNVIVIAIANVLAPPTEFGPCAVIGAVMAVERGERYVVGQPVAIAVPCSKPNANYPDGGTIWQDMDSLLASKYGRAYLDDNGEIALSQYNQLGPDEVGQ